VDVLQPPEVLLEEGLIAADEVGGQEVRIAVEAVFRAGGDVHAEVDLLVEQERRRVDLRHHLADHLADADVGAGRPVGPGLDRAADERREHEEPRRLRVGHRAVADRGDRDEPPLREEVAPSECVGEIPVSLKDRPPAIALDLGGWGPPEVVGQ
jgi:hypothetical protein